MDSLSGSNLPRGQVRLLVSLLFLAWSHSAAPQDFNDMCEGSALASGGCEFFSFATAYMYTGDAREFGWIPRDEDLFRRDRMFYFLEIRSVPADILVIALQTAIAEESVFWTPRSAGHYRLKVMACDPDLIPSGDPVDTIPSEHCSDWADSTNDEDTPTDLPGWFVYAAIKPPSGGGIE